ncbi:enoyl-CoA hydratase [Rhodococcus sp. WB9]|uniref:enoyl-CoA hydratase-related protein n=1 Tax=Rhodococcus sp. WB9 TaxID=2594007 RepID=UPI001184E438|nr:enoyl-CoA hydratase-related protein [Rhodococcus sp. WB9]QDQ95023.1 enoyl-CoA hydratase [Rhodococcus sp. WB9]
MTEFDKIRIERHDNGVRVLVLDDPEKRNAIGPAMRVQLLDAADQLSTDTETRCLVVTGSGTSFCAGADLMAIFGVNDATPSSMRDRQLSYYESFLWLRALPYPTIAAVNGHAIGAGLNLALACDITIAGPNARFGATFAKLGLHPGGGCTFFLTQRLGRGGALRTALLGRTLDGRQAHKEGLADVYVDDPLEEALTLAEAIAHVHPSLARDMKQAVNLAAENSFDVTVGFESWAQAASAYNPGVQDAIRAAGRTTSARSS